MGKSVRPLRVGRGERWFVECLGILSESIAPGSRGLSRPPADFGIETGYHSTALRERALLTKSRRSRSIFCQRRSLSLFPQTLAARDRAAFLYFAASRRSAEGKHGSEI